MVSVVRALGIVSIALFGLAIAWWLVVFTQVTLRTGFPVSGSVGCLLYTSDRCSLAMALCSDWHFLGIKRYSAELIWIAGALAIIALCAGGAKPAGK